MAIEKKAYRKENLQGMTFTSKQTNGKNVCHKLYTLFHYIPDLIDKALFLLYVKGALCLPSTDMMYCYFAFYNSRKKCYRCAPTNSSLFSPFTTF